MKVIVQEPKTNIFDVYQFVSVLNISNGECVIICGDKAIRIDLKQNIVVTE